MGTKSQQFQLFKQLEILKKTFFCDSIKIEKKLFKKVWKYQRVAEFNSNKNKTKLANLQTDK